MSTSQLRSELFSLWEKRLRGWDVYSNPVALEPSFIQCPKDYAYHLNTPTHDDARHTTPLSRFADRLKGKQEEAKEHIEDEPEEVELPEFDTHYGDSDRIEYHLVLPHDLKTQASMMGHIFTALTFVREPLSFEVIGTADEIVVMLACAKGDAQAVYDQVTAHEPDCVIDQTDGYLKRHFDEGVCVQRVVDFALEQEVMRPLAKANSGYDALIGVMGALSNLQNNECGALQFLFKPVRNVWSDALVDAVTNHDGSAFFADAPEMVAYANQKTNSQLIASVIRVAARADSDKRLDDITRAIGGSLMQLRDPKSNTLMPLHNDDYPDVLHCQSFVERKTYRSAMLLNLNELITIAHLPDANVRIPKLKRVSNRSKATPKLTEGHKLHIGVNNHAGQQTDVTLSQEHRLRHMHLIGSSGTGKTTLMLNMIRQDMEQGNGIVALDPHGDLIDTILEQVPEHRRDDVIVFDPSDDEHPIGFNIFDAKSELEKTLLASDLVAVFKRLSTSWGDQMNSVLANGISAMLESEQGGTIPILRRFLVDKGFRTKYLETVKDHENVFYWEREFPLLSGKPQAPVLTRLDTFLRPKPIRYMVAQKENKIDFTDIMQGKKIFLAKLSQGAIGAENSYLLGAFLVTKLNQIAFARQELSESQRHPFYLYIDEFHNFITPSMETILSGARKYGLGLILAHQELRQIESRDQEVAASVISNPFTRICFRLGDNDAKKLQNGFSYFDARDLQSLGTGEAIARVEQANYDFSIATPQLSDTDVNAKQKAKEIIQASRDKYSTDREEVEHLLYDAVGQVKPQAEKAEIESSLPGRGGLRHKEIQQEIKTIGEQAGFRATIEKRLPDGKGHVDVALERDDLKIAVEVSVTTDTTQELKNIQKCLDDGFDYTLAVSEDQDALKALEEASEDFAYDDKAKFRFLQLDGVGMFVNKFADGDEVNRGYIVESEHENNKSKDLKDSIYKLLGDG